ncbi:MAG: hypothetical protein PVG14_09080 [Anaerolineales bacterium]
MKNKKGAVTIELHPRFMLCDRLGKFRTSDESERPDGEKFA